MVKFKEYSKRCICILSVFVCFLTAVFCPSDVFLANENTVAGNSTTYNPLFDFSDSQFSYNSNLPIPPVTEDSHPSGTPYTYWYNLYDKQSLFVSSRLVYAYRISVTTSNVSITQRGLQSLNFVYGNGDDFGTLDSFNIGDSLLQDGVSNYWYLNDYAQTNFYIGALAMFGCNNSVASPIDYSCNLKITFTPYSIDDMLDEIHEELLAMVEGQDALYNQLVSIYDINASADEKLSNIRTSLNQIYMVLGAINNHLISINNVLNDIESTLDDILVEEQEQNTWLEKIWNSIQEFLGMSGEEDYEESPEDSEMVDLGSKEDALLGSSSPSDSAESLNVELDANASAFIWDTIDELVTANSTVFGLFISVLSLGIIALILGR